MIGLSTTKILWRLLMIVVAVVSIAVLYLAKVVFLPLAFAILFAFLLAPLVGMLERVHLPRVFAALIVIVGFACILGTTAWILFSQLVDVANDLPTYRENVSEKMAAIHSPSDSAFSRAQAEVEHLSEQLGLVNSTPATDLKGSQKKVLGASPEQPVQVREVSRPTGRLDQLGGVMEPLVTAFLSVVFTFFVLLQREDLRNRLIRLTGDRHLSLMTQAMNDASSRISRYFSLQLMVNVAYGAMIFTALYFIGLPNALLFGALSALCRFVPYVGAPFAALLPTVLSLAVFHGWEKSLMILGAFVCLEIVTANYAEPHLYGKHTGLSSLAILVAAGFWTLIWGPVGLILSVPLTVCLVVMGRHVPYLEFLTVMLGDQPAIPASTSFYQRLLARDEREAADILDTFLKDKSLEELYDEVVLPAISMSEEDRLQRDLEEESVRFIRQATRELIDEVGFKDNSEAQKEKGDGAAASNRETVRPMRVFCVPVRDETDELGSTMLCQLLDRSGFTSRTIPVGRVDEVLTRASAENPDIVFLSGMPPFGVSRSRRLYRTLRVRNPNMKIMIGIWNYADDRGNVAQKISQGEESNIVVTLAEAVSQVRAFAQVPATSNEDTDEPPSLLAVPDESAA